MRVLIIHQSFVDPGHPGGTRHFELARCLVAAGHEVTIIASNVDYLTGTKIVDTKGGYVEQWLDGIRVLRAYTYPSLHKSYRWRVVSFLTFMVSSFYTAVRCGPVDVIMGTSPPLFQLASAYLAALLRRRPFLLEIRDLWPEFAIDLGVLKNPLAIRAARWVEHFFYARAKHIVVNSPAYRDYLIEHGVADERIDVIPNGVDTRMFPKTNGDRSLLADWGIVGKYVATYSGALGPANDIPTILGAAAKLREHDDIHFLIVGDGKDRQQLAVQARDAGLHNVTFAGAIPKSRMSAVLAASDCCLATLKNIPMFRTTYPNKVFDYMAAAKPTVLGIDGVIREVVESACGGIFVPPGDERALADAILRLHDSPAEARQMGIAARNYVEQHFERRIQGDRLEILLKKLMGPK
ncbi:MAG: glycosyltransferase family 4 protein [Pirellulaceae bacterium]|nr:glycosyltransferase family 4 protein [Planctomycetales bacterium]